MVVHPQLPAKSQLRHLWAASHALAATSPAVSAHMMTKLLQLSSTHQINLPEAKVRHACTACGTVIIPGWNSHVHTSRKRKRKSLKPPNKDTTPGSGGNQAPEQSCKLRMVYECRTCGRNTVQEVPPSKPRSSRRARSRLASKNFHSLSTQSASEVSTPKTSIDVHPSSASSTPVPSLNASSKKRAKSRKGNSLMDILAAKKKQDSLASSRGNGIGGFGLDLMDLMKTG